MVVRLQKVDANVDAQKNAHSKKELQFNEILEVKSLALDSFSNEQKESYDKLPYRSKFMVKAIRSLHIFFAADEYEREIWLHSFAKVLEYNKIGMEKFNLRTLADTRLLPI